ncbi:MAG: energy-coupling factor ABC transporter permease [Aestuariivirga sp.]
MHIEPGVVDGAKLALSYATAAASFGLTTKLAVNSIRKEGGLGALALRSIATTALVFCFFELAPHHPVGVSEVHLILGSTLFLIFGAGPAAIGLALGLLIQSLFFAPIDLPQYGMNVTTLLVPLYALTLLAKRIIPDNTAYVDLKYGQALALSTSYQGGIVAWVAFWAIYGHGFTSENLANVLSFGAAYMTVVLVEPLVDLGVLAGAKALRRLQNTPLIQQRVYHVAA